MNSSKNRESSDEEWSWVLAASCCFTNFILYGIARLSGLLLVASVDTFGITREAAAFPFSTSSSVRNLVGPVVGFLGQYFGIRPVAVVGCILTSFGAGLCFFTNDIFWITVFWGGIYGAGFGLGSTLVPVVINQYFNKYQGTASGISYSGSYIGSCVFPGLVQFLLDMYGLSGTFLIISGLVMNCLVSVLLFTSPTRLSSVRTKQMKRTRSLQNVGRSLSLGGMHCTLDQSFEPDVTKDSASFAKENSALRKPKVWYRNSPLCSVVSDSEFLSNSSLATYRVSRVPCSRKTSAPAELSTSVLTSTVDTFPAPNSTNDESTISEHRNSFPLCKVQETFDRMKTVNCLHAIPTNIPYSKESKPSVLKFNSVTVGEARYFKNENITRSVVSSFVIEFRQNGISEAHQLQAKNDLNNDMNAKNRVEIKNNGNFRNSLKIFVDPVFITISISIAIYTFIIVCMLTVIKDFSRDINVPHFQQQYPLIVQSVADLIGTLSLGWITDRGFITRRNFIVCCFFGMGISVTAIAFSSHIVALLCLIAFYGIFEAGVVITLPLLTAQYIAPETHTVAIASSNIFSAPACLTVPIVIGYFRDHLGSYQGLFFLLGAEAILCSLLWICVPYIVLCRKNNSQELNSRRSDFIDTNI